MGNFVICVKGISGSGKSTRVYHLLKFFEKSGYTLSDFHFTNFEGKDKVIGVLIEELDLIFVGKIYKTGDIERWQGYDVQTGAFGSASNFSEFLKENSSNYSFIIEGAGITQTHRLRPKFLKQEIGFDTIMIQYYNYPVEGKQNYYDRIIYRSGEKPKKDVMWDKNLGFIKDCEFSNDDSKTVDCEVFDSNFDTPVYDFGVKFFKLVGALDFIEEFKKFVSKFDYIKQNKFENFK